MQAIDNIGTYNDDAEKMVLGSCFMDPDLIKECDLGPDDFRPGRNSNMFWTLKDLDSKGIAIDPVTLADRLGEKIEQVGGISYLTELINTVHSTTNFKSYCKIVLEHSQRRKTVRIAEKIITDAKEGDPLDAIKTGVNSLVEIEDSKREKKRGGIKEGMIRMYERLENAKGGIQGISTGFRDTNRIIRGYKDGDFVVVGARPSMGKTAYILNVAKNVAKSPGNPTGDVAAIFSLETDEDPLYERLAACVGNIDLQSFSNAAESFSSNDWYKLIGAMSELSDSDIEVYDESGINVNGIWNECRKLKKQYPGRRIIIFIDYLQLIEPVRRTGNRTEEISEISRTLKRMARQLKITVVALSQLSRSIEQRQDKRPMMSDLRESGQIEQDADIVQFLYREDYYDKESENKNMMEVIIAKQRNGPTGTVTLAFVKEFQKIVNIDWSQHEE